MCEKPPKRPPIKFENIGYQGKKRLNAHIPIKRTLGYRQGYLYQVVSFNLFLGSEPRVGSQSRNLAKKCEVRGVR